MKIPRTDFATDTERDVMRFDSFITGLDRAIIQWWQTQPENMTQPADKRFSWLLPWLADFLGAEEAFVATFNEELLHIDVVYPESSTLSEVNQIQCNGVLAEVIKSGKPHACFGPRGREYISKELLEIGISAIAATRLLVPEEMKILAVCNRQIASAETVKAFDELIFTSIDIRLLNIAGVLFTIGIKSMASEHSFRKYQQAVLSRSYSVLDDASREFLHLYRWFYDEAQQITGEIPVRPMTSEHYDRLMANYVDSQTSLAMCPPVRGENEATRAQKLYDLLKPHKEKHCLHLSILDSITEDIKVEVTKENPLTRLAIARAYIWISYVFRKVSRTEEVGADLLEKVEDLRDYE